MPDISLQNLHCCCPQSDMSMKLFTDSCRHATSTTFETMIHRLRCWHCSFVTRRLCVNSRMSRARRVRCWHCNFLSRRLCVNSRMSRARRVRCWYCSFVTRRLCANPRRSRARRVRCWHCSFVTRRLCVNSTMPRVLRPILLSLPKGSSDVVRSSALQMGLNDGASQAHLSETQQI
jgi:hypothetical protein